MATSSSKIRVGIVGANPQRGFASVAHIPALQALPDFEIVAVCTSRQESAEMAARHLALQTDRVPDPPSVRRIAQPDGLGGVAAERPFAIDMLAGFGRGHYRPVMVGYLDADRD